MFPPMAGEIGPIRARGSRGIGVGQVRRPETLTEAVIRHIQDAVIRGELAPGSRLPEVQLAASLETSRGTVREALRALQDLGLIEIEPHRGPYVASISIERSAKVLELRALLEGYAARRAVERGLIDEAARERLNEARATMLRAAKNGSSDEVIDTHLQFHRVIGELGGNDLLVEQLHGLQLQTRRLIAYTNVFNRVADAHEPLIAALLGSDADAVERVVRQHINHSGDLVLGRLAEIQTGLAWLQADTAGGPTTTEEP